MIYKVELSSLTIPCLEDKKGSSRIFSTESRIQLVTLEKFIQTSGFDCDQIPRKQVEVKNIR